jgi:hypothetical protein
MSQVLKVVAQVQCVYTSICPWILATAGQVFIGQFANFAPPTGQEWLLLGLCCGKTRCGAYLWLNAVVSGKHTLTCWR